MAVAHVREGPGPIANFDGFSLHAAVRIPQGCRDRLEKLCRYAARPPIVEDHLSLLPDGRVSNHLKKRHRDGSTHVVLDPLTFLERLCALVPRPRRMILTYNGVLAPFAGMRDRVVPPPPLPEDDEGAERATGCDNVGQRERHRPQPPGSTHGLDTLQDQTTDSDVLTCPSCQGRCTLLVAIHDPDSIRRILYHVGLQAEPPAVAPARPPRQARLPW